MTEDAAIVARPDMTELSPIPVHIVSQPEEEEQAALYASFIGWNLTGAEQPFQLLPQDRYRKRAVIIVGSGIANHLVVLCGANQVTAAVAQGVTPGNIGITLRTNTVITYEAQPAIWCVPVVGNSASVSVIDERYGRKGARQ